MLTLLICTFRHQYAVPPPDGYPHLRYRPGVFDGQVLQLQAIVL